jgi:hypothetical protein
MGSENEPEFVIGQPMADAVAREDSHREAWTGSASALSDVRYDWSKGDGHLLRIREASADGQVESFLDRVLGAPDEVADVRGALTTDDFYTLITFARRAIVRALRGAPTDTIRRAIAGIALIDPGRVDARDISWVVALSAWGVQRLDLPLAETLSDAQRIGTQSTTDAIEQSLRNRIDLADWGFTEAATASGPGLAERGNAPYAPTSNLLDAALALADAVAADGYQPASLTVATDLPKIWFQKADEMRLSASLASVRATITMRSKPAPLPEATSDSQILLAFLSECANHDDAEWLAAAARRSVGESHNAVVAERGPFLVALIARSVVVGTPSIETAESVARFLSALGEALETLAPLDML